MSRSKWKGHTIVFVNDEWLYKDTKEPVEYNPERACGKCGHESTGKGHDRCIKNLLAVKNACCGHGRIRDMYIQFNDDTRISGRKAWRWLKRRYKTPWMVSDD